MSKVLKAASVRIDENNRVSIEVLDAAYITSLNEGLYEPEDPDGADEFDGDGFEAESPEDAARFIIAEAESKARQIIENAKIESESLIAKRNTEFEEELQIKKEETLKDEFDQGY